jgi:hypothetical protein
MCTRALYYYVRVCLVWGRGSSEFLSFSLALRAAPLRRLRSSGSELLAKVHTASLAAYLFLQPCPVVVRLQPLREVAAPS